MRTNTQRGNMIEECDYRGCERKREFYIRYTSPAEKLYYCGDHYLKLKKETDDHKILSEGSL